MIVVDTNVVAYLVIGGPHTGAAEKLRRSDSDWRVPALFIYEWRSVLGKYISTGRMERDDALRTYQRGTDLVRVETASPDRAALRIFNLQSRTGLSTYDCEFVLLAETLNCSLATTDRAVIDAVPDRARSLST